MASVRAHCSDRVLGLTTTGDIAPDWQLGLLCGLGGLIGGYLGARLQPRLPETARRILVGVLATFLALLYIGQAAVSGAPSRIIGDC